MNGTTGNVVGPTGRRPCGDVAALGERRSRWPGPDTKFREPGRKAGQAPARCLCWRWARPRQRGLAGWHAHRIAGRRGRADRPTPASPILVPVEERILSADVVTRGTVRFGLPQPVSLAPSPLKAAPGLVTTLPVRNTQLNEGDVVLTASGRPVFVLQGQVPAYRDLVPGVSGADVDQLKQALTRMGFDPGSTDWTLRRADQRCGRQMVQGQWLGAVRADAGTARRRPCAGTRVERRSKTKAAAAAAVATAVSTVEAARAAAAHTVKAAAVENAARLAGGLRRPGGPATGRRATDDRERARQGAVCSSSAADADLAAQIAEQALVALDPRQTETARNAANAKLEVARAARQKARLEGELAVQTAEREASLAADRSEVARAAERSARLEGDRAVRSALDAQKLAALELKIASERVDQIAADLDAAKRQAWCSGAGGRNGVHPHAPRPRGGGHCHHRRHGHGIAAERDRQPAGRRRRRFRWTLRRWSKLGCRSPSMNRRSASRQPASSRRVATTPGTRGVDGFHIYLGLRVDSTPVRLEGFSVRLTIPIESTKGTVTAVPVSALSLATDGTSRLQVEKNGALDYVTVKPGLSSEWLCGGQSDRWEAGAGPTCRGRLQQPGRQGCVDDCRRPCSGFSSSAGSASSTAPSRRFTRSLMSISRWNGASGWPSRGRPAPANRRC